MTRTLALLGLLGACAGSFWLGIQFERPATDVSLDEPTRDVPTEPSWRNAVRAARASADAGSAREVALAVLSDATGDVAIARALELLGPVATPADLPLLESLVYSHDPRLERPALHALSMIGSPEAVDLLLELTRRPGLRGHALEALGGTGDPRALHALSAALDDPEVRHHAAQGLVALGSPDAVDIAIERFEARFDWDASTWADVLVQMPADQERARDTLIAASRSSSPMRREAALSALARHRDPRIYPLLATRALAGDEVSIRCLGQLDDPRAVSILLELIDGPLPYTGIAAVDALGAMHHPDAQAALLQIATSTRVNVAHQAVWMIRDLADPDVVAALATLAREGRQTVARAATSRLLQHPWGTRIPDAALEIARGEIQNQSVDVGAALTVLLKYGSAADHRLVHDLVLEGPHNARLASIWTLQNHPGDEARALLLALMDDPDPLVSGQAIQAGITRGGMESQIESLLIAHLEDADVTRRSEIATLLVQLDRPGGIARVQQMLADGDADAQAAAVNALMSSRDPAIAESLLVDARNLPSGLQGTIYRSALYSPGVDPMLLAERVLAYGEPDTQYVAAEALAQAATPEATRHLLRMSHDDAMRGSALSALARVGGEAAEARLSEAAEDPSTVWLGLNGLQQIGTPSARDRVEELARNGDASIRTQALNTLVGMPGPRNQDAFLAAVRDSDAQVRQVGVDALASLGTPDAVATLVDLLDSDDAVIAAQAISRMGGGAYTTHRETVDAILADAQPIAEPWLELGDGLDAYQDVEGWQDDLDYAEPLYLDIIE
jgi:HEAT repeat protein